MYINYAKYLFIFSASLFYVVKGKDRERIGGKLTKRIVSAVLKAMESHPNDSTIMRNCCLTLCQFNVPQDVVSDRVLLMLTKYFSIIKIVLKIDLMLDKLYCIWSETI